MLVFVQNKCGRPLTPCSPCKARKLLRDDKAKVVSHLPFVIRLLYGSSGYVQKVTVKVDTGSRVVGCAAVRADGATLYASETKTRTDIHEKMAQRASYRKVRRGRKTRYRPVRWANRQRKEGWLTPTMMSKVQTHLREITFVKSILPVAELVVETAAFDIHKITNPNVTKWTYSKGRQKDFYNVKAFVLSRDDHACQKCSGKKKDQCLHVHHIVFRSNGGTDSLENLITLCETCHTELHSSADAEKLSAKLQKKRRINTTDAVQVSTVGAYLRQLILFRETFGYETKFNREANGLQKAHFVDAMCAGLAEGELVTMPSHFYKKVSVARGDYQRTRGKDSSQRKPKGKTHGFSRYDKVLYCGKVGFVRARMSTGYAILMDIDGKELKFGHTVKFSGMTKLASKSSVICHYEKIKIEVRNEQQKNTA